MAETNAEPARRGFEAALRGDVQTLAALLAPEVRWHGGDPGAPGACRDRDEALAFMRRSEAIRGGPVR
jgi:ketosteroid isomerase-like protein